MAKDTQANLGFEKQLWDAACVLWGSIPAAEYRQIIVGLIFLRYISAAFEKRYAELVAEGDGFEDDPDAYMEDNIFFVPEIARWKYIAKYTHSPEIGKVLDDAMRAIEADNNSLKNVLPKVYASPDLDKKVLGDVVDLFTNNLHMDGSEEDQDLLGRTYEYCISQFAAKEGKGGGEFYTPGCVVRTLVEVLKPFENCRIYDPACGSGGMFVQSAKFLQAHGGRRGALSIYGQEANPDTWKMAKINMAIRGMNADFGKYHADTFTNDLHPTLKADFVMANPPFNYHPWHQEELTGDVRWKYGVPPAGNANYAWIQHMIYHLAPNGKIGLVLANGALSTQSSGEGEIRKKIIQADLVEAIVAMPSNLFYSVTIPVTLWFISRNKKNKGKTVFIDARKMGTMIDRIHRELSDEEIAIIAGTVEAFQNDTLEDEKGFCAVATLQDIEKQDYGSYGNGSAMRVSAAGWLYETLSETRRIACLTAEVTHNHPEGIKGAEATASAIYLARTGHSKDEIRDYVVKEFGYDLSRSCDEIRPDYHHVESCQETVPEAITAFLEGSDFEDVIRTAVSLGGDCDTLTCIAGSIAEAFYGVPILFEAECKARLPEDMKEVLRRFDTARGRTEEFHDTSLDGNEIIEKAIERYHGNQTKENVIAVLEAIRRRIHEDGHFMIPVIPSKAMSEMVDIEHVRVGDTVTSQEPISFTMRSIETADGQKWLAVFTSHAEFEKGESSSIISNFIEGMLKGCKDMSGAGIIINPWGKPFMLTKELINLILEADKPENHIYLEIGDITKMKVDAIVNAANKSLLGGGGVDGAIHRAAGPGLLEECRKLNGCETGEAKITSGWLLPAKYVIHTVGPRYKAGNPMCERWLHACYWNSLELAKQHDLHTVAFPAISTGVYGYPKQEAAKVALLSVANWLQANPDYGMAVIMVCRNEEAKQYYQNVIDACAPGRE